MLTKKEARAAWVAALRSGTYEQTSSALEKNNKFCCLGVACKVAEQYGDIKLDYTTHGFIHGHNLRDQPRVQEWLGLSNENGQYKSKHYDQYLTELNDAGRSFKEIADIIESEPEGLFEDDE